MQTFYSTIKRRLSLVFTGVLALLLTSCGVYYDPGYASEDGIYTSESSTTANEGAVDKTNYYKQYFQSKDKTFEDLPEEGAVFTDIDSYSTTESLDEEGYIVIEENEEYQGGNAGWGSNGTDDVTINIYNTPAIGFGGFNGFYGGFGYGGFGYGGYGFNPYWYGFGNPYWYRPFWGIGYSPYGFGFGGAFCYPYYGGYGYYNTIAYQRGRRNIDYSSGRVATRGRSNARTSYSRSELNRRIVSRSNPRGNSVNRGRPTTSRPNSSYNRPNSNRPSRPSYNRPSNNRPSNSRPSYSRPSNSRPSYSRPSNSRPSYSRPSSSRSSGSRSGGSRRGGRG